MLNVRVTFEFRRKIDVDAARLGMNRSEWVKEACQVKLNGGPSRSVQVRRGQIRVGRIPTHLCQHPMEHRSEPDAQGESRCLACNSVVRRLA